MYNAGFLAISVRFSGLMDLSIRMMIAIVLLTDVWEHWISPRPWPAEVGLLLVKEQLIASGVPVAYMQYVHALFNAFQS